MTLVLNAGASRRPVRLPTDGLHTALPMSLPRTVSNRAKRRNRPHGRLLLGADFSGCLPLCDCPPTTRAWPREMPGNCPWPAPRTGGTAPSECQPPGSINLDDRFQAASSANRLSSRDALRTWPTSSRRHRQSGQEQGTSSRSWPRFELRRRRLKLVCTGGTIAVDSAVDPIVFVCGKVLARSCAGGCR